MLHNNLIYFKIKTGNNNHNNNNEIKTMFKLLIYILSLLIKLICLEHL